MSERVFDKFRPAAETVHVVGILAAAPFLLAAFVGTAATVGVIDYIQASQEKYGVKEGTKRVLGSAVLIPVEAAVAAYETSHSISMAVAAGSGALVAEAVAVGFFVENPG